ncbi:MAG: hypothetical protein ABSE25_09095 [Syntrophorhabdales bacterium]|jgi:hypothetical protein
MAYEIPSVVPYYPVPNRANHRLNLEAGPDKEYEDIGWNRGVLSDGRPFRVEYWCCNGLSVLTFFMSTKGIEKATDRYFRELLVDEGILTFLTADSALRAKKITDASGNEMWSVNVAVGDQEGLLVGETVLLKRYREPG